MKYKQLIKFYYNKKIIVTGHTGFVGSWLSFILSNYSSKVYGVSLKPNTKPNNFHILGIENKIKKSFILNILNKSALNKVFRKVKPDIVFHLAAQPYVIESYKKPEETIKSNYIGTFNILECIRKFNTKQNVIITTDKVYENLEKKKYFKESDKLGGKDIYSGSKAAAEILCESYFHSFLKSKSIYLDTARAGNIIGGGDFGKDRLVPDIIRSIKSKKKFHVRSPNSIRPWQHIFDVCFGYMLIPINQQKRNSLKMSWNFGQDKRDSKYKVSKIVRLFKKNFKEKFVFTTKKKNYRESKYLLLDSNLSKTKLKWHPKYSFGKSMQETINWYKTFLYNKKEIKKLSDHSLEIYKNSL